MFFIYLIMLFFIEIYELKVLAFLEILRDILCSINSSIAIIAICIILPFLGYVAHQFMLWIYWKIL